MHARQLVVALLALLVSLASARAQETNRNATLLSVFAPGTSFLDVWGIDSGGKEYALLGTPFGVHVVNCTDPRNPRQTGFIPGPASNYRDVRTWGSYAYAVTEGGAGMQIIDLTDPDNPTLVQTWGEGIWHRTHNVAIDLGTGYLYACGTDVGMPIVDLADPINPTLVDIYPANAGYVHKLHVERGVGYFGEILASQMRLADVTDPFNVTTLSTRPVLFCHGVIPTRDLRYAVVTTEGLGHDPRNDGSGPPEGGPVTMFDITDNTQPVQLSEWRRPGWLISVHNAYPRERVVHVAYYSEGYVAVDISDPANPREVASFDTSTWTGGLRGARGCYPYQPSGNIYISDENSGLHIFATPAMSPRYGSATAAAGAAAPTIHAFGAPFLGNRNFGWEVEGAPPHAEALLILSSEKGDQLHFGVTLNVNLSALIGVLVGTTDSAGRAFIPMPIGKEFPLRTLYAQFVVADPVSQKTMATRGARFTMFRR